MTFKYENNIPDLIEDIEDLSKVLGVIGAVMEAKVKETITGGRPEWPPLKESTVKRKGHSKPLIETGMLRASITHKVEGDMVNIGIFGSDAGDEYVKIDAPHEFGTTKAGKNNNVIIPARPFLRPTLQENRSLIKSILERSLNEILVRYR